MCVLLPRLFAEVVPGSKGVPLSEVQQEKIVNLLMAWIEREMKEEPIQKRED